MPAGPFLLCLTASITVGHATDREHVQVVVPTVKGAFGNPRTALVRLQCQPLSPIHSSGRGTQLATSKGKPMRTIRYISLFSGIEAATVAWHQLGWKPIAYAEIEPFPKAVLRQHYPEVPDLGDVTKVDWKQYHHAADVVVGGSPCQAFSIAGLRKALDDPRGQLMLEYLRACAEIDPEWIVWENVPGVLSAEHGRAFQSLLEAVAELWPDGGGCMASAGRSVLRCGPATRACVPCRQY